MSTCFEVYPTNRNIPENESITDSALKMFRDFLKFHGIETEVFAKVNILYDNITITINNTGNIYLFRIKLDDIDVEVWNDELKTNPHAKSLENEILQNRKIGYLWQIKRTAGQPAIVSLFYGFVAMALAKETNGFIYSDDGACDYKSCPTTCQKLYSEHFDIDNIKNSDVKSNVLNWINLLKRS